MVMAPEMAMAMPEAMSEAMAMPEATVPEAAVPEAAVTMTVAMAAGESLARD